MTLFFQYALGSVTVFVQHTILSLCGVWRVERRINYLQADLSENTFAKIFLDQVLFVLCTGILTMFGLF